MNANAHEERHDHGPGGEHDEVRVVHVAIDGQEHADVASGADPVDWSIVPAGLAGVLREVVEHHLPPDRAVEAGVDPAALVWDLTVAAETWQTGAAPYRPGVVL